MAALDVLALSDTVLTRLLTLDPASASVYDGVVPEHPTLPYVAYYANPGVALNARMARAPGRASWSFFAIAVGVSRSQCIWVSKKVRDLFVGWRPDPDGSASPLTEVDLGNDVLANDELPGDVRYSFTLRYTLHTTRSLNG